MHELEQELKFKWNVYYTNNDETKLVSNFQLFSEKGCFFLFVFQEKLECCCIVGIVAAPFHVIPATETNNRLE